MHIHPLITPLLALLPLWASSQALAQNTSKSKTANLDLLSDTKVQFSLLTDTPTAAQGQTITLGLRFTIAPHWHIYWNGANDTGTPPTWKVEAPTGWTIDETAKQGRFWPVPVRYISPADTIDHVYFDDVVLLQPITIPSDVSPGTYPITFNAKWLVCEDACIPEKASSTINITVVAANEKPTASPTADSNQNANRALIEASRARTPKPLPPQMSSSRPIAQRTGEKGSEFELIAEGPGTLRFMPGSTSLPLLNVLTKGEVQQKEAATLRRDRASVTPSLRVIRLQIDEALAASMLETMGLPPDADPLIEGVVEGIAQTDTAAYWVRAASPELLAREQTTTRPVESPQATEDPKTTTPQPPK